ncbi:hypothetical protein [Holdemania filiformis]|uniref:hypothetical protein n=1 Tax=Holdemania filiformis TaxID=61171 RepID=UPI0026752060|nr:hypothetical protein [Holdemania filiformis]
MDSALCRCGHSAFWRENEKTFNNHPGRSDVGRLRREKQTAACSYTPNGLITAAVDLEGKEDQINKFTLKMIYDQAMFGNIDFSTLTAEEKAQLIDAFLAQSGIDEDIKGIRPSVEIQDSIILSIAVDLKEVEAGTLENLGVNLSEADSSFSKAVQALKDQGFTCQ